MRQSIVIWTVALCCVALQSMGLAQSLLSEAQPPRPDIVLIQFGGYTGPASCRPFGSCNWYEWENSGIEQEIRAIAAELGQSILVRGYSDYFVRHYSPVTNKEELGLEDALQDMDWAKVNWPGTQYIVASGSQGVIFSHLFVAANPDVVFRYLIDLDGLCGAWNAVLQDFKKMVVPTDPERYRYVTEKLKPYLRADLCVPKSFLGIPGTRHTFADLIPWHVTYNLEVRPTFVSHNRPYPPDTLLDAIEVDIFPNIRENGSRVNIYRLIDTMGTHNHLKEPGQMSVQWVGDTIRSIDQGQAVPRRSTTRWQ